MKTKEETSTKAFFWISDKNHPKRKHNRSCFCDWKHAADGQKISAILRVACYRSQPIIEWHQPENLDKFCHSLRTIFLSETNERLQGIGATTTEKEIRIEDWTAPLRTCDLIRNN